MGPLAAVLGRSGFAFLLLGHLPYKLHLLSIPPKRLLSHTFDSGGTPPPPSLGLAGAQKP